jgi:4-amino-4-deoxy-L-arabinose transferase-like glycosyltransferase
MMAPASYGAPLLEEAREPTPSSGARPRSEKRQGGLSRSWEAAILLLITLLAAALRFYRLTEIPPGMHFDEGFKGVTGRALLEGAPPKLFFERDMGEEPIAMYLVTAALGVAGQEPWAVRLPSAVVGTLTVPLAWWLGRELFRLHEPGRARSRDSQGKRRDDPTNPPLDDSASFRGQVVGLGTAFVLAVLYWHLSFSRIGMEPILVPFFATLAFASLVRGFNSRSAAGSGSLSFALGGLALGGSLYTYKAGYLVPVVAILFVAYAGVVDRGFLRRHGRGLLLVALVALLAAMPIGLYFATHPANFLQRPASVALVGSTSPGEGTAQGTWQALVDNVPRVLGMFFWRGDANPRSNLPGRPVLDPFLALLFLIGLGRALVAFRRPAFALPLIWLGVMVVPSLVTDYAPHFGRAIGATPAVALLCALGGWSLWLGARSLGSRWLEISTVILLALGLVFSGASTARAYFHTWARSPDLFYAYDVGLVEVAEYINTIPEGEDIYLTPTSNEHYTLEFVTERPFASFDGRAGLVLPPQKRAATILVLLREDGTTLPTLQQMWPEGEIAWTLPDSYDRPYAAAYHLPAARSAFSGPEHPVAATLGDAVQLLGYSLDGETASRGDTLYLTLYWQALAPLDKDYTVFTHLLGEHNPATNGPLWAGHDGQPDGGHYPTTAWQPGQIILDVHPLSIAADAPAGEYRLETGLYHLESMTRLPAADSAGNTLPGDAVLLGTVKIRP